MKFLERRDPEVYNRARQVIRECDERKKQQEPGFESITESIRTPLKQLVGPAYWKQVRSYLKKKIVDPRPVSEEEWEPLSPSEEPPTFTASDLVLLEQSLNPEQHSGLAARHAEKQLRRERFWMLIGLLMKNLEQKDPEMYFKAKMTIKECVKRFKTREPAYRSLTGSVRVAVKEIVGPVHWRRAEHRLANALARDEDFECVKGQNEEEWQCYHSDLCRLESETSDIAHCNKVSFDLLEVNPLDQAAPNKDTHPNPTDASPLSRSRCSTVPQTAIANSRLSLFGSVDDVDIENSTSNLNSIPISQKRTLLKSSKDEDPNFSHNRCSITLQQEGTLILEQPRGNHASDMHDVSLSYSKRRKVQG